MRVGAFFFGDGFKTQLASDKVDQFLLMIRLEDGMKPNFAALHIVEATLLQALSLLHTTRA